MYGPLDRCYRLVRTYVLKKGTARRIWGHVGKINQDRLEAPSNLLLGYFLDFSYDAHYEGPFDDNGMPLVDYGGAIGIRLNPWAISHYALANFQQYLEAGDRHSLKAFLRCANWLSIHGVERNNRDCVWMYDFSLGKKRSHCWISSLAQAHAISVLLRAFLLTRKPEFLKVAKKAFVTFSVPVGQGGVQTRTSDGYVFFEEDTPPDIPHILNGFMFSLWGIYEFGLVTEEVKAWDLWQQGLETLKKYLPYYDCGFFSLYSLYHFYHPGLKDLASPFYHSLHVKQLDVFYKLTGERIFREYAVRWKGYLERPLYGWLACLHKIAFKLLRY